MIPEEVLMATKDLEYIQAALRNAQNLSFALDYQEQVKNLTTTIKESKLTKSLNLCVQRIDQILKENDEPELNVEDNP